MLVTAHGVLATLKKLGDEETKRSYMNHGAKEPLFGVPLTQLKALKKSIKTNHELALSLYQTGNSDAMYFAGLIDDPEKVTPDQLATWVEKANWDMISERCVAVLASKTPYGFQMARQWILSDRTETKCAGYALYGQLFRSVDDKAMDMTEVANLLDNIAEQMLMENVRTQNAMTNCLILAGVHIEAQFPKALKVAAQIGQLSPIAGKNNCNFKAATAYLEKYALQGKIGIKIKHPRN